MDIVDTMTMMYFLSCLAVATVSFPSILIFPHIRRDTGFFFASAFMVPETRQQYRHEMSLSQRSHLRKIRGNVSSLSMISTDSTTVILPPASFSSNSSTSPSVASSTITRNNTKLRRLKDRMWVREALEDLTAAEFASSLTVEDSESAGSLSNSSHRKRAVDFENVLHKLEERIEQMCIRTSNENLKEFNETYYTLVRPVVGDEGEKMMKNSCLLLAEDIGMGSVVYTTDQRETLLHRLLATRDKLVNAMDGSAGEKSGTDLQVGDIDAIRSQLQSSELSGGNKTSNATILGGTRFDPSLYVREDGTIDWDGALQDREALKKFGSAVWSRINGQDPEISYENNDTELSSVSSDGFHSKSKLVTAKIAETETIKQKEQYLNDIMKELREMEIEHTKLLNSAISAGQATANVNLAIIDPTLRVRIRTSSDELERKRGQVTFHTLNYDLERIFTYLEGELGNTATKGYIPLQDRLNVAEFGLLESQIESLNRQIEFDESLDADVLAVVTDQLTDFKRRLGIDYALINGLTFDSDAIRIWIKDVLTKAKRGIIFYIKGFRLFLDDITFCLNLIGRALQGYTLKPREVRTLRRTFKDTVTLIPVIIILIIPLSPIGHVLVFGAIQRVFPDFFPSCFTERRQNLLELYESTEYSAVTINESWKEKIFRIFQAFGFFTAQLSDKLYTSLGRVKEEKSEDNSSQSFSNES